MRCPAPGEVCTPIHMQTIRVNLGPRSYDIAIGHREAGFAAFVRERLPNISKALFVADENTRSHADRVAGEVGGQPVAIVPPGEESKSLTMAARLFDRLADLAADRQTPVIAVGGGVVGDLAGFVAATYNRGLPLVMVPTTLLAMVDSSVGGKVGINLPQGKNLVGAFHQPVAVWIDAAFLDSLPDREYRSGLAEVVKYGVIKDAEFFRWLEANADAAARRERVAVQYIVAWSCRLKADVVERDEREEMGLRMVLNYGHTFAHAFEAVGGYAGWLHGEAVAAGMVCASRLAERRGLIPGEVTARLVELLRRFGLPTVRRAEWDPEALLTVMRRDKKNVGGRMRFILPTQLGRVAAFDDVPEALVREVLAAP
jgi:3-dehydroquinate synthase